MDVENSISCTAFQGSRKIASGTPREVARRAKQALDRSESNTVLVFDNATSEQVEIDFRGTLDDVLRRLGGSAGNPWESHDDVVAAPPRPGRPKLGVVAREVTLLPRHWEWLNNQPGGASVALRKLVEQARRDHDGADRVRRSQEAAYRFMSAMAGDRPGFEEATRALFARDGERFAALIDPWPADIRNHAKMLAEDAVWMVGSGK